MIDLHMHTTASDGRSTPEALVREAAAAGCRTMAVTDHDTVASVPAVRAAARAAGLGFVPGIEMTAVDGDRDIHILGYFVDTDDADFDAFLVEQRALRRERVTAMAERLASLGAPVDLDDVVAAAALSGRAIGRPAVASALVAAGHARDLQDAFDRYLAEGRPGHVRRTGASPVAIVEWIRRVGGFASIAHPGKYGRDDLIPQLASAGMAAIEVFHPDHPPADVERYRVLASTLGLAMTGGSDYHGPGTVRAPALGRIGLTEDAFQALMSRATGSSPA
ncbi:MAG: PHP domain-containing protein [Acidobacteriota bacterium]